MAQERFVGPGVRGITVCDTTRMVHPAQVKAMCVCDTLQQRPPDSVQLTPHFHNTRGMGLANVPAAVQSGTVASTARWAAWAAALTPGASGKVASEDAIHMLQAMGYGTG
ncbi:hypothetical protein [Ramlibacter sp.]|uniref:hypothetical protein n=1 Tax=Ramlibacter sp. TaxID=1917967 RepID=UPI00345D017A